MHAARSQVSQKFLLCRNSYLLHCLLRRQQAALGRRPTPLRGLEPRPRCTNTMCGRGRQAASSADLRTAAAHDAGVPTERPWKRHEFYQPTENLGPGRDAAVVTMANEEGPQQLCTMRWGLIASFDKSAKRDHWRMFNARSETLGSSPVFKRLLRHRRCAVPLDGFFEWTSDEFGGIKDRQPYYVFRNSGEPLWFAGLYDTSADGTLDTFTLCAAAGRSNPHVRSGGRQGWRSLGVGIGRRPRCRLC